jgi:hypothetical protein
MMENMDPVSGRGWAMIKEGQLHGKLYFHDSDDSGFAFGGFDTP